MTFFSYAFFISFFFYLCETASGGPAGRDVATIGGAKYMRHSNILIQTLDQMLEIWFYGTLTLGSSVHRQVSYYYYYY